MMEMHKTSNSKHNDLSHDINDEKFGGRKMQLCDIFTIWRITILHCVALIHIP